MAPPRYDEAADEQAESEALILHRLDTDPKSGRPRVHTIPSAQHDDDDNDDAGSDIEGQSDEMLEKRRIKALAKRAVADATASSNADPTTGRPPWLVEGTKTFRRSPPLIRGLVIAIALVLLGGVFYFALGDSEALQGGAKKIWSYGGEVWKGGSVPYTFPGDVGHPGPTATGAPGQLEEEDKLTGTRPSPEIPVETHLPTSQYGSFKPFDHMGPLTPYKPSDGFGVDDAKYHALPASCKIEQVHMLHRHGSRYPTSYSPAIEIQKMLAAKPRPTFSGPLDFLNTYEYRLGKELLVPLGRQQLYDSGVAAVIRYGKLIYEDVQKHGKLFARAGSQHRIVESGRNWLAGALGAADWEREAELEIQIEDVGFNTTMAPNFACPNADKGGKWEPGWQWNKDWIEHYAIDAAKRLGQYAKGVEITPRLINGLQQLCSYDTVAGYDARSICSLFSTSDWQAYEYAWDLSFYGSYGSGSPLGPAQGVGWVNEFLSRLQGQKWDPKLQTSENATLDSYARTFPVDRKFYVDFTHDSVIANVLAALNLPEFAAALDPMPSRLDEGRRYKSSEIVPFAARLVFEKIQCGGGQEPLIRMLLNDAIVPLKQLKGSGCDSEAREDGMCTLKNFLRSQEGRMERVRWEQCFEK